MRSERVITPTQRKVLRTDDVVFDNGCFNSFRCRECKRTEGSLHYPGCRGQRDWAIEGSELGPTINQYIKARIVELDEIEKRSDAGGHFGHANEQIIRRDELLILQEKIETGKVGEP